jgi:predicted dithiol-disulfide oxidoreductase (DUF899 family)
MCPACFSTTAMAAAGIGMTWTSSLMALVWRRGLPRPTEASSMSTRKAELEITDHKEITMALSTIENPKVVSRAEWLAARKELLVKEKELTRSRDALSQQRRELPWVKIDKPYIFEGPNGKETLSELFAGRSQLIVYHFMLGPGWREGCVGCSFLCDHIDGALLHVLQHDVSFVAVSRAPLAEIEAFKTRMGWKFKWVSSYGSDFNYDYHVSFLKDEIAKGKAYYNFEMQDIPSEELPGTSVFYKDGTGGVFHTYSSYARGGEGFLGTYNFLDITPKGRNETGDMSDWVRHHDRYNTGGLVQPSVHRQPAEESDSCCHATENH